MAPKNACTIIPTLRYRDVAAAIEWLCRAFGFEKHLFVPGESNTIVHAQLTFGNGMMMLGTIRDDDFGKLQRTPEQVGGVGTQSPYIIVPDADAHHARAVALDAKVVYPSKSAVPDFESSPLRQRVRHVSDSPERCAQRVRVWAYFQPIL